MENLPFNTLCIEPDSGFRSLLSFLILDELMLKVSNRMSPDHRLPMRHVFDLVGGEGSGGLVALLAGRLNLSSSAPSLLKEMMPKFCPRGAAKRLGGVQNGQSFGSSLFQPMFGRLDNEEQGECTFYSRQCVRTVVLASLEETSEMRGLLKRVQSLVERVRGSAYILQIRLWSRLKLGTAYNNMFFSDIQTTDPVLTSTSTSSPPSLKERFRSYDPTISRPNVYISDVAQATFTHNNLVPPKTINGRRYASKMGRTDAILDILDEANACFPNRKPGIVVRIGGRYLEDLSSAGPRLGRSTEIGEELKFLNRAPKADKVFQISLPEVMYGVELVDDPDKVYEVFETWRKQEDVGNRLDRCAEALCHGIKTRAKHFPNDVIKDLLQ